MFHQAADTFMSAGQAGEDALRALRHVPGALADGASGAPQALARRTPARGARSVSASRLVRCVADEAGLGRFIYLRGRSGARYVFCGIEGGQARLYDRAVFALRDGERVELSQRAAPLAARAGLLYIHLLADADADAVMDDICGAR